MIIKQVRIIKKGAVKITIDAGSNDDGTNRFTFTCFEQPKPEFFKAMEGLKVYVQKLCELEQTPQKMITVTGVKFTYAGENNTMGASIFARKHLANDPKGMAFETPHKISGPYKGDKDGDPGGQFTEGAVKALNRVIDESKQYVAGIREQKDLFVN